MRGYVGKIAFCDFKEVSDYFIIPDLQGRDPRIVLLFFQIVPQNLLTVLLHFFEPVKFRMEAGSN